MPVELRKRKATATAAATQPPAKKSATSNVSANAAHKAERMHVVDTEGVEAAETASLKELESINASKSGGRGLPEVGDAIDLNSFGGIVETHDGHKTTLSRLVDESKTGVILFTYPRASTPGCTTQACLFRDSYEPLTSTGFSIFGLSSDGPKTNTKFKAKQNLPYTLLCDPSQTLISAIGFKKKLKGTARGIFIVNKIGKVLAVETGGPATTFQVAKSFVIL